MKHTKGQWHATSNGYIRTDKQGYLPLVTPFTTIAHRDKQGKPTDEAMANARLIAAAPDQNALLVEALNLVPRISDDDPMAPALAEWCRKARSLIAKAKGE